MCSPRAGGGRCTEPGVAEADRHARDLHGSDPGVVDLDDHVVVEDLGVGGDLRDRVQRRCEHVGGDEALDDVVGVELAAARLDRGVELVLVREALLDAGEARVVDPVDVEGGAELGEEAL